MIFLCLFILVVVIGISIYVFSVAAQTEFEGVLEFITIILMLGAVIFTYKKLSK